MQTFAAAGLIFAVDTLSLIGTSQFLCSAPHQRRVTDFRPVAQTFIITQESIAQIPQAGGTTSATLFTFESRITSE